MRLSRSLKQYKQDDIVGFSNSTSLLGLSSRGILLLRAIANEENSGFEWLKAVA